MMPNPPLWNKGKGRSHAWLVANQFHEGDDCLTWPFSRTRGYGALGHMGKRLYAHRAMCELVNGPAPSPIHQASHSCGNGHLGCVNPRHLCWKTPSENLLDRKVHGTHGRGRADFKLSPADALEIRRAKGSKTLQALASRYGVSYSTVSDIWNGRTHKRAQERAGEKP